MQDKAIKRKLEESFNHIAPYISKKETPELYKMCSCCERWCGKEHDYNECRELPCFQFFLAYEYLIWENSYSD